MAEKIVIIDYGSGNLRSAEKAFQRVGGPLGCEVVVTNDVERVRAADRIVLPGVGAFGDCAAGLRSLDGMTEALTEAVIEKARPVFGVCVGCQLMATRGVERGTFDGLGWIPGEVVEIEPSSTAYKIPHMGWNALENVAAHPVFDGMTGGDQVYFVHSYHMRAENPAHVLATANHGGAITAAIGRDNMVGTQFHPEKSQQAGQRLIENFLRWQP